MSETSARASRRPFWFGSFARKGLIARLPPAGVAPETGVTAEAVGVGGAGGAAGLGTAAGAAGLGTAAGAAGFGAAIGGSVAGRTVGVAVVGRRLGAGGRTAGGITRGGADPPEAGIGGRALPAGGTAPIGGAERG